jgi:hypothetical protein
MNNRFQFFMPVKIIIDSHFGNSLEDVPLWEKTKSFYCPTFFQQCMRTGQKPCCSLPMDGSRFAQTISPLNILAIHLPPQTNLLRPASVHKRGQALETRKNETA